MNNSTIGANLAIAEHRLRAEDLAIQKQVRNQRRWNNLIVWMTLLLVGVGLGYHWRMKQEQAFDVKVMFEAENIACDRTQVLKHKLARKYLTGGTNSWLKNI